MRTRIQGVLGAAVCAILLSGTVVAADVEADAVKQDEKKAEGLKNKAQERQKDFETQQQNFEDKRSEEVKARKKLEGAMRDAKSEKLKNRQTKFEAFGAPSDKAKVDEVETDRSAYEAAKQAADIAEEDYAAAAKEACDPVGAPAISKPLDKFGTSLGSDVVLVSALLASAYSPLFMETSGLPHRLGLHISSSLPAKAAKLADYANQELLLADGGFANVYLSLGPDKLYAKKACQERFSRPFQVDRMYIHHYPLPDELLMYITHGIGVKAIRTDLEGGGTAAVGSVYFGVGFDGPLFNASGKDDAAGQFDVQAHAAVNWLNKSTIAKMFQTTGTQEHLYSAGVSARIFLTGTVAAVVDYEIPIGGRGVSGTRGITIFSISYTPSGDDEEKKKEVEKKKEEEAEVAKTKK